MSDVQRILADHPPQPGYCLVLRPFNDAADRAWNVVKRELEATFRWTDIKDLISSGAILDQILKEIARNDVVIVDITGENPNVFFELGITRAAKPERKVIIVRREGDEDDRTEGSTSGTEGMVPFDVRSDRYLTFAASEDRLRSMLPLLEQRVWDALEKSQWFLIREREVYSVGRLESADGSSTVAVAVQPTAFVERQFGPKAGRVHVVVTIAAADASAAVRSESPVPQALTASLGYEETMALGSLPWRLKFHKFEDDKARFCLESTSRS